MFKKLSVAVLLLLATACAPADDAKVDGPAKSSPPDATKPIADAAKMAIYNVKCGCSIDDVGHCGNYVMIDGKYVPLIHPSLGKMQFCAKKDAGAKIEAQGAMQDGKFVAQTWKLVE